MKEKAKKYGAYALVVVGFYLCACLVLVVLNLIGIGSFDSILGDGFWVAVLAGIILLLFSLLKKYKEKGFKKGA